MRLQILGVADVGEHLVHQVDPSARRRRHVQTGADQQGAERDRLEGDRLAPGVGAREDQDLEGLPEVEVVGHHLVVVDEGVTQQRQAEDPLPAHLRFDAAELP